MTEAFPVLPLRDIVVFPQMIVPLFVGRDKSVAALESAMAADKTIFLVSQIDPSEDDPDADALFDIGVTATVLQLLKLPDGTVRVLVEGKQRARMTSLQAGATHDRSAQNAPCAIQERKQPQRSSKGETLGLWGGLTTRGRMASCPTFT